MIYSVGVKYFFFLLPTRTTNEELSNKEVRRTVLGVADAPVVEVGRTEQPLRPEVADSEWYKLLSVVRHGRLYVKAATHLVRPALRATPGHKTQGSSWIRCKVSTISDHCLTALPILLIPSFSHALTMSWRLIAS